MLIIGHRGAGGLAPENTIRSFQLAKDYGVDLLECDLRRTKDDQIVLCHDANLQRTHGLRLRIKDLTLAQLRQKTAKTGKEIVELSEFLGLADRPINLDVKDTGIEEQTLQAIKGFAHKVLITAWNPRILKKIRALDGNISIGPILGYKYGWLLPIMIVMVKKLNVYSITIGSELVNVRRMERFKKLGWKVLSCPVDAQDSFKQQKIFGVDGVFTDRPDIIKSIKGLV